VGIPSLERARSHFGSTTILAFALIVMLHRAASAQTEITTLQQNQQALTQALNLAWVLLGGFLVMFMQVGFALLETGFTRAKNAVNVMAMNLMIYPIGLAGFWMTGYALMLGGISQWPSLGGANPALHHELAITIGGHSYGLIGLGKFALLNVSHDPAGLAMFLLQSSSWIPRRRFPLALWLSAGSFRRSLSTGFLSRCFSTRSMAIGYGVADGFRN
jgi:hypothetical protein